jgi:queuine/archaeosine tRNA-ribosyltransferase
MASFRVTDRGDDGYGRLGEMSVPHGPVETPALFPVINLIGGTTVESGGVWRRMRDRLIASDHLQGVMFQAMSFTDYGVSPGNLKNFWREQTFHERFDDLNAPVFIDSGGFKLMNSNTFGDAPEEGGTENEWGLYTDPKSILGLQVDFGADIIATLDYPIPPNLREEEKFDRMKRSIDSAVECLRLLDNPAELADKFEENDRAAVRLQERIDAGDEPGVYVALHGHDYETVNWYVGTFIERLAEADVDTQPDGFAIGSLVPLRSSVDVLVDIVQGAKDAIPESRADEMGLHVFGIGGKQVSLLALLGVDSFDCSSHMQAAKFRKYLHPQTWENLQLEELDVTGTNYPCNLEHCLLCRNRSKYDVRYEEMMEVLNTDFSYDERQKRKENDEPLKSDYYALLARHNFEVYNEELRSVRECIRDGRLLEYIVEFAREDDEIKKGLEQAQIRDKGLRRDIEQLGAYDLLPGTELRSDQKKLSDWDGGVDETNETRSISLEYGPNNFDISSRSYTPPDARDVCLLLPCSQKKPYSESRTHSVLLDKLGKHQLQIHKVTVSGMYGPVPEEFEQEDPVLKYEYVLAGEDEHQIELATDRVIKYLETHGDHYEEIVGYVTSKTYRQVIGDAIRSYGRGKLFPTDPKALQLTEFFRNENIQELVEYLESRA